jgi:hypothetical protein
MRVIQANGGLHALLKVELLRRGGIIPLPQLPALGAIARIVDMLQAASAP